MGSSGGGLGENNDFLYEDLISMTTRQLETEMRSIQRNSDWSRVGNPNGAGKLTVDVEARWELPNQSSLLPNPTATNVVSALILLMKIDIIPTQYCSLQSQSSRTRLQPERTQHHDPHTPSHTPPHPLLLPRPSSSPRHHLPAHRRCGFLHRPPTSTITDLQPTNR